MSLPRSFALLAMSLTIGVLVAAAPAAEATPPPPPPPEFYGPMVPQLSENVKRSIGVFRQTDPITLPELMLQAGAPDPGSGYTLLGLNVALARPALPRGSASGKPYYWLAPASGDIGLLEPGDYVAAFEFDHRGREVEDGGFFAKIDSRFAKYGVIEWYSGFPGAKKRTSIRGLVPDSVKSFKVVTRRRGKKPLTTTYKIRDNTILLDVKNPIHIIVKGKKFKNPISASPGGKDEGQFVGDFS